MTDVSYPNLFVTVSYSAFRNLGVSYLRLFVPQAFRTRNIWIHMQQTNNVGLVIIARVWNAWGTERLSNGTQGVRKGWGTKSLGYETPGYEKVRVPNVCKPIKLRCCQYSLTSFVLLKCLYVETESSWNVYLLIMCRCCWCGTRWCLQVRLHKHSLYKIMVALAGNKDDVSFHSSCKVEFMKTCTNWGNDDAQ